MAINREKNIFTYKLYSLLFGYDEKNIGNVDRLWLTGRTEPTRCSRCGI